MIAYVDESVPEMSNGLCYVVAAAVLVHNDHAQAREKIRKLLLPGQARFHWTSERAERRFAMLELVAALDVMAIVQASFPCGRKRQNQARRSCLTSLLGDLASHQVGQVVIEHRDEAGDRLDRQTFVAAKHGGIAEVAYGFRAGADEPLLWVADAIAGAVSGHLAGWTSTYYERLAPNLLLLRRLDP